MSRKSHYKCMSNMYCCSPVPQPQVMCCMPEPDPMCCIMPQAKPACCGVQQKSTKSICSFPCLIILILILLVFGNNRKSDYDDPCSRNRSVFGLDTGILFIIALFYLCCATPCAC